MHRSSRMFMLDVMKFSPNAIPVLSTALDAFNAKYIEGAELNIPFIVPGIVDKFIANISSTGIILKQKYSDSSYYGLVLDTGSGEKSPVEFWVPKNLESWKTNINLKNDNDFPIVGDNKMDVFYYYENELYPEEIYLNSEMYEDVESFFFQTSLIQDIIPVQEFREEVELAKKLSDMLPEFSVLFCDGSYFPESVYHKFVSVIQELKI